jgi:hypothetical protein
VRVWVASHPESPEMRSISHKHTVIPCGHMGKAHVLCGFAQSGFNEVCGFVSRTPVGSRRADLARKREYKNFIFIHAHRGGVTNWYQSMVTTLGLLGLMNELRRNSI